MTYRHTGRHTGTFIAILCINAGGEVKKELSPEFKVWLMGELSSFRELIHHSNTAKTGSIYVCSSLACVTNHEKPTNHRDKAM